MTRAQQLCTFVVGDMLFGIEVERVQEVSVLQGMTPVPLAPAAIAGLINLRGEILTAIDLRVRLGLERSDPAAVAMNVVIRSEQGNVGLVVDDIGDMLEVRDDSFEPPPETLDRISRELIRGTYKLSDRLVLVLDTERALALDEQSEPLA